MGSAVAGGVLVVAVLMHGTASAVPQTLQERFPAPAETKRMPLGPDAFGTWLRSVPLLPEGTAVHLHDGRPKPGPAHHAAVLDIDVGTRDLQQCADAVMRLRAEYLWSRGQARTVCFRFTSGHAAAFEQWALGKRPQVNGSNVQWVKTAAPDASRASFRRYLDVVFTYAGSASLVRELTRVSDPRRVEPGDVFIQGGFPGHAVLVMDVVEGPARDGAAPRWFLLAQSYMPAQQIHVLKNPEGGVWYEARAEGTLVTPEWRFTYRDLHRFGAPCAP